MQAFPRENQWSLVHVFLSFSCKSADQLHKLLPDVPASFFSSSRCQLNPTNAGYAEISNRLFLHAWSPSWTRSHKAIAQLQLSDTAALNRRTAQRRPRKPETAQEQSTSRLGKKISAVLPSQERVQYFLSLEGATRTFLRNGVFAWLRTEEKKARDWPHTAEDERKFPRKSSVPLQSSFTLAYFMFLQNFQRKAVVDCSS